MGFRPILLISWMKIFFEITCNFIIRHLRVAKRRRKCTTIKRVRAQRGGISNQVLRFEQCFFWGSYETPTNQPSDRPTDQPTSHHIFSTCISLKFSPLRSLVFAHCIFLFFPSIHPSIQILLACLHNCKS